MQALGALGGDAVALKDDAEEGHIELTIGDETDARTLTDQLVADTDTVACWTCGSEVAKAEIEATLARLQASCSDMFEE